MNKITDDVKGKVIGGNGVAYGVYYDGRRQHFNKQYADNEKEATQKGKERIEAIKKESGTMFNDIYPKTKTWELRIYQ